VDVAVVSGIHGSGRVLGSPASTTVLPEPSQYLVITVSNPRRGHVIPDTEALFIPFKGQYDRQSSSVAGVYPPPPPRGGTPFSPPLPSSLPPLPPCLLLYPAPRLPVARDRNLAWTYSVEGWGSFPIGLPTAPPADVPLVASVSARSLLLAEGWQPIKASPSHVAAIRKVWHRGVATLRSMDAPFVPVPAPEVREGGMVAAPTPYTTGLGLPLSRALAKAGERCQCTEKPYSALATRESLTL
jgi:hypothetical protein